MQKELFEVPTMTSHIPDSQGSFKLLAVPRLVQDVSSDPAKSENLEEVKPLSSNVHGHNYNHFRPTDLLNNCFVV